MADGVSTFEQFVRFGTDAYGLERLLRGLQSLTAIILFFPGLRHLLLFVSLSPATLAHLRKRLSALRQPFRLFRFLDSFSCAWSIFSSPLPSNTRPEVLGLVERWMDFGSKAFTSIYLLLESLTFVDVAVDIPGLGLLGSQEQVRAVVLDGQRFWFLGLVCGILCALAKLGKGEGRAGEKRNGDRRRRQKVWRRLAADVMDLAVPGSVVGWVPLSPGKVGLLMLGSTILTGMEVWERCGREVAATKAGRLRLSRTASEEPGSTCVESVDRLQLLDQLGDIIRQG
ncbi:hypothetical protein N657DRAFT_566720 [Parathielavia appendiculata]|uniref:Uncharacterized protein n=1 Tax=Parathielavia appendiculata TaxID=2587402 RepID=A0AAN6Z6T7_9PEZI|nr:hypothetical protein N657DRAFT_566720 [Parathielavia appendiculata]